MMVPALDRVGDGHIPAIQPFCARPSSALPPNAFGWQNFDGRGKLDELVPSYLDQPLIDPFDGQPLRMKQVDGSFIVYSIGLDRNDDNGQLHVKPHDVKLYEQGSDIGFRLFDPAKRCQPAKPFVIDEMDDKDGPN